MSKFEQFPKTQINDFSLYSRPSKVEVGSFGKPLAENSISSFVDSLPDFLAARDLLVLARKIRQAKDKGKPVVWGFGGHVVKVGLAPILIDLMNLGYVTALATNGSGMIHDFEIALAGRTSEEVDVQLQTGAFGMARETGESLNRAICEGAAADKGIGEAVGEFLCEHGPAAHPESSLLVQAFERGIPFTVHVAIGTDTIHNHPQASGEALGKGSLIDFRIFTAQVARLEGGGVFINAGSAVLLPEVFLKAVSMVRNSGQALAEFTTANLDFIQHYRPTQNVVRRPVASQGTGIAITGHHEIMIPLLAAVLKFGGKDQLTG